MVIGQGQLANMFSFCFKSKVVLSNVPGEFEEGCLVVVLVSGDFERVNKLTHFIAWMPLAKYRSPTCSVFVSC